MPDKQTAEATTILCLLNDMPRRKRREWVIRLLMKVKRQTYRSMANRHKAKWQTLQMAVTGKCGWTPTVIHILETELETNLEPYLECGETRAEKKLDNKLGNL